MGKRTLDVVCAGLGLIMAAPILALAALAIYVIEGRPVLHRARRIGAHGRPFAMYKLRTMRPSPTGAWPRITGYDDPRVSPLGRLLRKAKVDELPQLVNVLRGEMSIVGPRPEDPDFVWHHYAPIHHETLGVRPGLSSPGSLYHDTHCEGLLTGDDPEGMYLRRVLPLKLALDLVYVRRASVRNDVAVMARTIATIVGKLLGRRRFPDPPELSQARALVTPLKGPGARARAPVSAAAGAPTAAVSDGGARVVTALPNAEAGSRPRAGRSGAVRERTA